MSKLFLTITVLLLAAPALRAQKFATKIIALNDTSIDQFTDVNQLYFLFDRHSGPLQKLVQQLSVTTDQAKANKIIESIAGIRNPESAVILSLDRFFKSKEPISGSNVANVINRLNNSNHYDLINQYYLGNAIDKTLPAALYHKKIQDTIGWAYGYGAFYYLSPADSLYLEKMKLVNVKDIDKRVAAIIRKYLRKQGTPFAYDRAAILKEVNAIDKIKDAQWDDCLIKTDQLPNWDNLGVIIVSGSDTVERIYTVQYGKFKNLRMGKHIFIPLRSQPDVLWYTGVHYGLHFVRNTRRQCDENIKQGSR